MLRCGAWFIRMAAPPAFNTSMPTEKKSFNQPRPPVLATFTLNNVKLLSLSKIGTPYDPATAKGTLGKNLTHQVGGASTRIFFDKPLNAFMGSGAMGMMIADFDGDHALSGSEAIVRGGTISVGTSGNRPIASFGSYPAGAATSNWGSEWKAASLEWRDKVSSIGFTGEHLAYRHNFMDLDPVYTDKMGDPLLRFTLDWTEHEHQQRVYATEIQVKIAQAMGLKYDTPRLANQIQRDPISNHPYSGRSRDGSVTGNQRSEYASSALGR